MQFWCCAAPVAFASLPLGAADAAGEANLAVHRSSFEVEEELSGLKEPANRWGELLPDAAFHMVTNARAAPMTISVFAPAIAMAR
jgi:hypothetical protein